MQLTIVRTDGNTGRYTQDMPRREAMLQRRLDPRSLFCSGPIVIGVLNPFTVLNPDEICWIEVESDLATISLPVPHLDHVRCLQGREEYERLLARQWPRWRKAAKGKAGDLLEALVELTFRGGAQLHFHLTGKVADVSLVEAVFGAPAIVADMGPRKTVYVNPKTLVRARVYHSKNQVAYPHGIWVAEADEV